MSESTKLMRITRAEFGEGGYQDACIGFSLTFETEGAGVSDFKGTWNMEPSQYAAWTVADQDAEFAKTVRLIADTLRAAKKRYVSELKGVPVEVTFEGNVLKSWRILTEVL